MKRRVQRQQTNLAIELTLYHTLDDSILVGPAPSFLYDFSYYGVGLILPKIYFSPHHLFYSPRDNENHILCLETMTDTAGNDKDSSLIIPIVPKWFRLGEGVSKGYFRMGVEFHADPEDSEIVQLEEMALACLSPNENISEKLLRIFL